MIEHAVPVDSASGPLNGVLATPDEKPHLSCGLILVDGSGPATRHAWDEMPSWFAALGVATLRHDKPGCGGSPGDWRTQTFADRAADALTATALLRREADVDAVGLIGYSQGGWISLLAATTAPEAVDFIVTVSGPTVGVAEQERVRLERELRHHDLDEPTVEEALRWVDERARRLVAGESPAAILAEQARQADRPWHGIVNEMPYADEPELAFGASAMAFDPAAVLPEIRCPMLALFGSADESVPVERSLEILATRLPTLRRGTHGVAVFPGADHMLYVDQPRPGVERLTQFAPAFLPMLGDFLQRIRPLY
jgi:pimeloyl-ACP methyl ester carboxylesterase